ncbi:MAG: hypothetical protein AAGE59_02380, partial [Cyanobacteria bacterium P01_F01_bin.86]
MNNHRDRTLSYHGLLMAGFVMTSSFMVSSPLQAYDDGDLERLLTTNACPDCDLADADLRRYNLSGADL